MAVLVVREISRNTDDEEEEKVRAQPDKNTKQKHSNSQCRKFIEIAPQIVYLVDLQK